MYCFLKLGDRFGYRACVWVLKLILLLGISMFYVACDDQEQSSLDEAVAGDGGQAGESMAGENMAESGGVEGMGGSAGGASLEEGLQIDSLSHPVGVRFDALGFAHISCSTRSDCFAAQGYVHASHRFVQMDINRMFPQGRLTERVGRIAKDIDRGSRLIFATRTGERIEEQMWASSSPETREMLEAYARGVNAWLADFRAGRQGAKLSEEYSFPLFTTDLIEDWDPKDSLSVALILIRQLTEDGGSQIRRGERLETLGAELFHDLYGFAPAFPSAVLTGSEGVDAVAGEQKKSQENFTTLVEQLQGLSQARLRLQGVGTALKQAQDILPPKHFGDDFGSNNWVVAPERSSSGKALLSNDPHLGLSNPSVWYLAHLRAEGDTQGAGKLDVQGFTLPGLPSVVIGHNEKISWGMTTTYFDFSDVYLETLSTSGDAVLFQGEEVPFVRLTDDLVLADDPQGDQIQRIYVPHHGPVLSIDREAGVAVTLRWTAQDADTDVNFLLELPLAQSVEEAREALKNLTTIGQNVVVADTDGHIGWFPYNRLPTRPWMSPVLNPGFPLPGDGSAEWGPSIPYDELPQAFDPALGVLATANHDMTGAFADGDPTNDDQQAIQEDPAKGYRYSQIMRLLDRQEPHNVDSLLALVHDRESLIGRRLLPELLQQLDREQVTAEARVVLDALEAWGYDCPAGVSLDEEATPVTDMIERSESKGCLVFHTLLGQLIRLTFRDELSAAGALTDNAYIEAIARLIARPEILSTSQYWDNVSTEEIETMADIVAQAVNRSASKIKEKLGDDSENWLWGVEHTVTLAANLLSDAGFNMFNHGPFPNHGGLYTVDVANPRDIIGGDFTHGAGASMRFVCELDEYPRCHFEVPSGQRHFRDDPHYDDLFRLWLARSSIPMRFEELEIESSTVERWHFND